MFNSINLIRVSSLGLALVANAAFAEPPEKVKELDIDITIVGENDLPEDVANQIQLPDFANLPSAAEDDVDGRSDREAGKPDNPGQQGLDRAREQQAPGLQDNPGLETREQVQEQVRERLSGKGPNNGDDNLPPEVQEIIERARGRSDDTIPDKGKPDTPGPGN